ncbi:uncharacterized protein LOC143902660 [Temnothorax americanus]|uniref:uncharacterized protein LOC143902660 n=1 Tax=Temnothorax americanus TaxID=1964332 RepID=UPI0040681D1A
MVESGLLAAGSVGGFLSAKNFNRAKRLHVLVSLSLKMEHFKFFLRKKHVQIRDSLIVYLKTLPFHGLVDDTIDNVELRQLIEQYLTFKEETLAGLHGKTPQYYTIYVNLIDHYLTFNRSIHTGDFELMKYVLPKINNIFFPFNHINYARWLIKYCDNLMKVAKTHPDLFEDFKAGYLGIKRTSKSFSRQGADLVVEQTINADAGRTLTGITHFTNSIKARTRWTVDFALRAEICTNLLEQVGLSNVESVTNDLKEDRINRNRIQIAEFISGLNVRMNPFDESLNEELLYNIAIGEAAPKEVELFLTSVESTGHEMRINMINSCAANENAFQTYKIKKPR